MSQELEQQRQIMAEASAAMFTSLSSMISLLGEIHNRTYEYDEAVFHAIAPKPLPNSLSLPTYLQNYIQREHAISDTDIFRTIEHGLSCPRIDELELRLDTQEDTEPIVQELTKDNPPTLWNTIGSIGIAIGTVLPHRHTDSSSIIWLEEQKLKQLPNHTQTEYVGFVNRFSQFYSIIAESKMDPATMSFVLKTFIDSEEPFLRQMFSDYDKAIKDELYSKIELDSMAKAFNSPEVREMYERIMKRSNTEDSKQNTHQNDAPASAIVLTIPNGLSKEDMKIRLSEKYSYENLINCDIVSPTIQQQKWGEIEHVFYEKTKIALNGGKSGRITKTICDNISTIYWTLIDAGAIDMTERNFSLLIYRFAGINCGREDNDQYIHWLLDANDLSCFLKYTVLDGGKYSWASKFFKIGEQEYISGKQSSVYADKSPLRESMYELGMQIGTCKSSIDD